MTTTTPPLMQWLTAGLFRPEIAAYVSRLVRAIDATTEAEADEHMRAAEAIELTLIEEEAHHARRLAETLYTQLIAADAA